MQEPNDKTSPLQMEQIRKTIARLKAMDHFERAEMHPTTQEGEDVSAGSWSPQAVNKCEGFGAMESGKGFGTGGRAVPERRDSPCWHPRFTVIAKERFKDRIVMLERCRRCTKVRTVTISRDENARSVFVKRTISNVQYVEDAPESAPKPDVTDEETGSE